MSPARLAPPAADPCLVSSYSSRGQKGGTLVEERVADLATHEQWLLQPDRYRPARCGRPGCTCTRLHVHDRRDRRLCSSGEPAVVTVLVFICAACSATWRVLPRFLARCLWRTWDVVEAALLDSSATNAPPVARRTVYRWRTRFGQAARLPLQVLAAAGGALQTVAREVGLDATRAEVALAQGRGLASLAGLLHRLAPGVRLM